MSGSSQFEDEDGKDLESDRMPRAPASPDSWSVFSHECHINCMCKNYGGISISDLIVIEIYNKRLASLHSTSLNLLLQPALGNMLNGQFAEDYIDIDHVGQPRELSPTEYSQPAQAGPSHSKDLTTEPSYIRKHALNEEISAIDDEIRGYDQEIKSLETLRAFRVAERDVLLKKLQLVRTGGQVAKGKGKMSDGIDYHSDSFDWSRELKVTMKKVFGINTFRLCQEGVCNANLDGRDIVCVMPTGGGKSLTYQLPALLMPGCTLVISPLISLITDQVLHLTEAGVEAVKLTGGTPKEEAREIMASLARKGNDGSGSNREIKLCYVTPEKIAKSNKFLSVLEKLVSSGRLARIVVDEAHCVSQLGHDFRPDYGKLSKLRQLFPRVPMMALSATCPPKVLQDLITNLMLDEVVDGSCAKTIGTVYFSAPLYRKNLHYTVVPKRSASNQVIRDITDYILEHHADDSGIIYCITKKDAETIASGLRKESQGKIKTGVYHSEVNDQRKEELHHQWRKGIIKVVCATIAFGLGIDKGNVRFVLHHSISKSMDGFYQESGRAGRDGEDADCILYYRPQDATRLSEFVCGDINGQEKLHSMLRFAQDMQECRKVHFARYFSASSDLSLSSWTTDSDVLKLCGHCDNCTRPPESVDNKDVTFEAWQILKICDEAHGSGGRFTIRLLADLVRGVGSGVFEVSSGRGKGKEKDKHEVDLAVAGGKVKLSGDDTEILLVQLLITRYLAESYHQTAYGVNVYVTPGPQAPRLSRLTRELVENGKAPRIMCSFRKVTRKRKSTIKKPPSEMPPVDGASAPGEGDGVSSKKRGRSVVSLESDASDYEGSWFHSLRSELETHKRPRKSALGEGSKEEEDIEVIILSD